MLNFKIPMNTSKLLIAALLVLLLGSCSDAEIENMDMQELLIAIDKEVGTPYASSIDSCKVMPIGSKPCGGPNAYVVYSNQVSSTPRLEIMVERFTKLQHEDNIRRGLGSDCAYIGPPEVVLDKGVCTPIGRSGDWKKMMRPNR